MDNKGHHAARALALVYPDRCIFCGKVVRPLSLCCDRCRQTIRVIKPPLCRYCGKSKKECDCKHHRHAYERVVAPFYSDDGAVHRGLLRLKRCDDPHAIDYYADQMLAVFRREFGESAPHVVTFVPVTKETKADRGYNQGQLLAEAFAKRLSVPCLPLLTKLYDTRPQKGLLAWQRSGNVLGVFDVTAREAVAGKTIVLVDDVLTTGATLDECCKMLKLYGAFRVFCVTVAIRDVKENKKE